MYPKQRMSDMDPNGKPPGGAGEPQRLTSWKEIAAYLGVSDKTAQLWEKTRGLPVERIGSRVSISERDLQAWQQSNRSSVPLTSPPPAAWWTRPHILKWWAFTTTGVILLFAIGAAVYAVTSRAGQPVSLQWQGSVASAVDAKGRSVWTRQFPYPLMEVSSAATQGLAPWIGDVDGDGTNETVLAYYHVKRESEGWEVYCLSSKGDIQWRLTPTRAVRNSIRTFHPPYVMRAFAVFPSPERDGTHWTAAVFVHHTEYPSTLLVVDSKGKLRGEYWQAGHLNALKTLDLDGDGIVELIAAGIQHGVEQAVLVVLDPRDVHGVAELEPGNSPRQLRDMAKGSERKVVYFPRTELNLKLDHFNFVSTLEIVGDVIQATVYEHISAPEGYLIYNLTRDLKIKELTMSVSYMSSVKQRKSERDINAVTSEEEIENLKKRLRVVHRRP